jgi:hypothetical protein
MAAFVGKVVAKKLLNGKKDDKHEKPVCLDVLHIQGSYILIGDKDPFHVQTPATRLGVNYTAKRKKPPPPGLTKQEEKVLAKAKRRAYRLDQGLINVFGFKIGWSAVIGLIPG